MNEPAEMVLAELRRVARETLSVDRQIELDDPLHDALGLDSLSALVVAVALEDRFRVQLQDERVDSLVTVNDLVKLVCAHMADQRGEAKVVP